MAEKYDLALMIIDIILAEIPKHVKAITLKADIFEHLEKYDDAIITANQALSIDPNCIEAFCVLSNSYEGLRHWQKVIDLSKIIIHHLPNDKHWRYDFALFSKANACLEMGNLQEAEKIIVEFENGNNRTQGLAQRLRNKMNDVTA